LVGLWLRGCWWRWWRRSRRLGSGPDLEWLFSAASLLGVDCRGGDGFDPKCRWMLFQGGGGAAVREDLFGLFFSSSPEVWVWWLLGWLFSVSGGCLTGNWGGDVAVDELVFVDGYFCVWRWGGCGSEVMSCCYGELLKWYGIRWNSFHQIQKIMVKLVLKCYSIRFFLLLF
jgi:hypothetical protein